METEMIDKLFLELSQVTRAKTEREIGYEATLRRIQDATPTDHEAHRLASGALLVHFPTP